MKEEQILAQIRAGEEERMGWLIDKYSRLLWPIASAVLYRVGTVQDVEECVADAFICLWEHPEKFDPSRGSLKSLLCILVCSRAIDRYRTLSRQYACPLEEAALAQSLGLEEQLLHEQTRRELLALVDGLDERNREILVRRYYWEQKPRQIALAMNLTVKQVNNALYRSKAQLRRMLQTQGGKV